MHILSSNWAPSDSVEGRRESEVEGSVAELVCSLEVDSGDSKQQ